MLSTAQSRELIAGRTEGRQTDRQTHLCKLWLSVWFGSFISVAASHLEVPTTVSDKAEANGSEPLLHIGIASQSEAWHQSLSQSYSLFCFSHSFTWSLV